MRQRLTLVVEAEASDTVMNEVYRIGMDGLPSADAVGQGESDDAKVSWRWEETAEEVTNDGHRARPDDDPEPGDRCKDCGKGITWMGPSPYEWVHRDES